MKALVLHDGTRGGIRLLWATVEFLAIFIALLAVLGMLYQTSIAAVAAFVSSAYPVTAQHKNPFWIGYDGETNPWQWGGPDQSQEYWLNETQTALSTMQTTYWNGTYWPSTIQWIGALINNILISTQETLSGLDSATNTNTTNTNTTNTNTTNTNTTNTNTTNTNTTNTNTTNTNTTNTNTTNTNTTNTNTTNTNTTNTNTTNTNTTNTNTTNVKPSVVRADVLQYYAQTQAYFDSEDTIQIFDAAYDDAQWVVLEWLEAIKFIDQYDKLFETGKADTAMYAHRAHIFYNIVQDKFNTSLCEGGLDWNPKLQTYKNAITNELFISSSIAMYLYFPGDTNTDPYPHPDYRTETNKILPSLTPLSAHEPLFLTNAVDTYDWFRTHNFTNAQGLITDGFHISPNQTTCDERNEMVYTYNQAVLLSGLRGLWDSTGNTTYLTDGHALISTVINATGWNAVSSMQASQWSGLGRNGILEDYCDAAGSCSQDGLIFKGAYFQHFSYFCRDLPTEIPLVEELTVVAEGSLAELHRGKCRGYEKWVRHNAHAALSTLREDGKDGEAGVMGEWWGAAYLNQTQSSRQPSLTVPPPAGSVDIRNEPWLLDTRPWRCRDGQDGCPKQSLKDYRLRGGEDGKKKKREKKPSEGQVRTVETQAQGLNVVRTAAEFALRDL